MPLTANAKRRRDKDQRRAVNANMRMADMGGWKVLKSLHDFVMESASADGPRMTEMRYRVQGVDGLIVRLWASNGKGTPVDRVVELRTALNAANARLRALNPDGP